MRLQYFEMIDSVDRIDAEGGHIEVTAQVPQESPVFEGHFPGFPIVPGVLLLESINQAAGFLILEHVHWRRFPFFAGARKVKCRQFVLPGTTMTVTADIAHDGSGFAVVEGRITVDGKMVAEAEITLTLQDYPSPEFAAEMHKRAHSLGLPARVAG
jgi:3-hydroxyacyl-[acyl-carrier-protein] dehydratase